MTIVTVSSFSEHSLHFFFLCMFLLHSKFKMTDPGFDRVGKIGSDGNPLVRVKHFMWQYICCVDMSDEVRPGKPC